jgi:hypothetical protein
MIKAIFFMLIGAVAISFAAFKFRDSHVAHVTAVTPLPDRLAGPFKFDIYAPKFTWVDTVNGVQQRGVTHALVQVRERDGRVEICGTLQYGKIRRDFDDRALAWLKQSFIVFRDMRVPADFIELSAVIDVSPIVQENDEKTPLRCVLANVAWHKRYVEMHQDAVKIEGPPVKAGTLR